MTHAEIVARIQDSYRKSGVRESDIPTADKIVPGYVCSSTALVAGSPTTNFVVTQDKTPLNYEQLINRTDAFAVCNYGLLITNEIVANPGKAPLVTYPNIIQFPASLTGLVAADLEQVYNGYLSIQVAQSVIVPNYPSHNFRVVRTTQQASASTFSEQLPVDGFASADPLIILDGSQKISSTFHVQHLQARVYNLHLRQRTQ